jgi:lysophospholipase L1-like esterase
VTTRARRLVLWFVPSALGVLTAVVLAGGAAAGLSGRLGERVGDGPVGLPTPAAAPAAPVSGAFRIVALGDSLTRGAGDAAGGGGYPERVAAALRKAGLTVSVDNLAIDGSETGDFLRKVEEAAVRDRIAGASLILVSIGGNDLSHSIRGAALPGEAGAESDPTAPALRTASLNLQRILSLLRASNPSSPIRILGLYDPFPEGFDRRMARQTLLKWNVALEEASFGVENALVVPTADVFDGRPDRLSSDRFHPGAEGYAEIAARVIQTLRVPAREARPS